jgi:hypothetical protein
VERRLAEQPKALDNTADLRAEQSRHGADLENIRNLVATLRADSSKADVELSQRVALLEGKIQTLTDMVNALAARAPSSAPAPGPVAGGDDRPSAPQPPAGGPPPGPSEQPKPPVAPVLNPAVAKLCKDLRESPDDGVRFNATTELTNLKDPSAIPALVQALAEDKHYFVRRGAARALSAMKSWMAVPALIKALEDREVYVALMANQALQTITGADFGVTQDTPPGQRKSKAVAAEKWWEKNKDKPPDGVSLHPTTE